MSKGYVSGTKFKIFNHLLEIASDIFFLLAKCDVQLAKSNENETISFSVCIDKIVCQISNIS